MPETKFESEDGCYIYYSTKALFHETQGSKVSKELDFHRFLFILLTPMLTIVTKVLPKFYFNTFCASRSRKISLKCSCIYSIPFSITPPYGGLQT